MLSVLLDAGPSAVSDSCLSGNACSRPRIPGGRHRDWRSHSPSQLSVTVYDVISPAQTLAPWVTAASAGPPDQDPASPGGRHRDRRSYSPPRRRHEDFSHVAPPKRLRPARAMLRPVCRRGCVGIESIRFSPVSSVCMQSGGGARRTSVVSPRPSACALPVRPSIPGTRA